MAGRAGAAPGRPAAKKAVKATSPGKVGAESARARKERTAEILARLKALYPDSRCALDHRNAYELLTATILAAQCTDQRVNQVTPALFARFPDATALAGGGLPEIEELVKSTGFYRNKARSLAGMAQAVVAEHGGEVPARMEALVELPGVGRKTANVILGNVFGQNVGVVVDTHVHRLSRRLGLTAHDDAEKIERDLMALVQQEEWTLWSHLLIDHGRAVCKARKPECAACVLASLCPSAEI